MMSAGVQLPKIDTNSPTKADDWHGTISENVPAPFFKTIPPERVGLDGKYDHNGLANRVNVTFQGRFSVYELQDLQVTQRGQVVVLYGTVPTRHLLNQLVELALAVPGAATVETYGISIGCLPESA